MNLNDALATVAVAITVVAFMIAVLAGENWQAGVCALAMGGMCFYLTRAGEDDPGQTDDEEGDDDGYQQ